MTKQLGWNDTTYMPPWQWYKNYNFYSASLHAFYDISWNATMGHYQRPFRHIPTGKLYNTRSICSAWLRRVDGDFSRGNKSAWITERHRSSGPGLTSDTASWREHRLWDYERRALLRSRVNIRRLNSIACIRWLPLDTPELTVGWPAGCEPAGRVEWYRFCWCCCLFTFISEFVTIIDTLLVFYM
jgi:hypothetical protein